MDYIILGILMASLPTGFAGRSCYTCTDRHEPHDCLNITVCAPDHQCHVRKYVNSRASITYDFRCMPDWFCDRVRSWKHEVTAKRQSELVVWNRCCNTDNCNTQYDKEGKHYHCQDSFIPWRNSCYLFDTSVEWTWKSARSECQHYGADLASVNTKEEDDFLISYLSSIKPPVVVMGLWLGAVYDGGGNQFKWLDGSDVTYSRFATSVRKDVNFNIELKNPMYSDTFSGWPWGTDVGQFYRRGYVCEKNFISN